MLPSPPRVMYCGRCGAPLAPGAAFCGRCGTPVAVPAAAAVAPPMYAYPQAPRVAYPTARQFRLSQVMIAGGLIVILLLVAAVVSAIAVAQFANQAHSTCTSNCGPKFVTPLPEEASYKSSGYKYQVNYTSEWTVRTQDASGITLGTKLGSVQVVGMNAAANDQVLQSTVNALPSSQFQDVTLVSNLKGAHIGDEDGIGAIYGANFVGTTQTATKVRFAVIVATRGGVTIIVLAVDPADLKNAPNGMPEGQLFDYFCTEVVWG
jgi:zinc-ribbon domain